MVAQPWAAAHRRAARPAGTPAVAPPSGGTYNPPTVDLVLDSPTAAETHRLGVVLGRCLPAGCLVLLAGPLGAGKTTLAQGIAEGLGVSARVISPSFTLVREYAGAGRDLVHMDFYRLEGEAEVRDLAVDDYLEGDAVIVVEWPERAPGLAADEMLSVRIELVAAGRELHASAHGAAAEAALGAMAAAARSAS